MNDQPIPYDDSEDDEWTEEAFDALKRGDMKAELSKFNGVVSSRVQGPCPRCGHRLDDQQTHSALPSLLAAKRGTEATGTDDDKYYAFFVTCHCTYQHPHAPEKTTGCGVSFTIESLLQDRDARP